MYVIKPIYSIWNKFRFKKKNCVLFLKSLCLSPLQKYPRTPMPATLKMLPIPIQFIYSIFHLTKLKTLLVFYTYFESVRF